VGAATGTCDGAEEGAWSRAGKVREKDLGEEGARSRAGKVSEKDLGETHLSVCLEGRVE